MLFITGSLHLIDHVVMTTNRVTLLQVAQVHETGTGLTTGGTYESTSRPLGHGRGGTGVIHMQVGPRS